MSPTGGAGADGIAKAGARRWSLAMHLRSLALFVTVWSLLAPGARAAGTLVAGPMLGYNAHREVLIWVETRGARTVALDFWPADQPDAVLTLTQDNPAPTPAGGQITKFTPGLLTPGTTYGYRLAVDGAPLAFPHPLTFTPRALWEWRRDPPDFKFLAGSCAYFNEPAFDRPGPGYGKTLESFRLAAETGADFMVWLGDNWYYREPDYSSRSGLWHRAQHDRATPELRKLLAVMHHYATWDDHDFGPNDPNRAYEFKDETRRIFQTYWGNPSAGEADDPGIHSKWTWGDAAFFLLDDYTHRDDAAIDQTRHPEKTQWGRRQLEWLKQSLLQAQSLGHFPFKFIGNGTQFLQTAVLGSSHEGYRRERAELLDFIREQRITGVVFLTGDVHHSGVYRQQLSPGGPWVYEVTASPLTSGSWEVEKSAKARDPLVVPGTLVGDQNFVQLELKGPRTAREIVISCTDRQGVVRFTHHVTAAELGAPPATKPIAPPAP